jgi:transposase InsO family protein
VREFLHDHIDPGVFAPDAVRTLIAAFDGAWQSITAKRRALSLCIPGSDAPGGSRLKRFGRFWQMRRRQRAKSADVARNIYSADIAADGPKITRNRISKPHADPCPARPGASAGCPRSRGRLAAA